MSDDVKLVRLISGEELVCKLNSCHSGSYELDEVAVLLPGPEGNMAFAPWMPYAKKPVTISANHVLFVTEPVLEIVQQHQKVFGRIVTLS